MSATDLISASCPPARRLGLLARLHHMAEVARSRRALRKLAPHQLEDLGICKADAHQEAARPFWDAPGFWRA